MPNAHSGKVHSLSVTTVTNEVNIIQKVFEGNVEKLRTLRRYGETP